VSAMKVYKRQERIKNGASDVLYDVIDGIIKENKKKGNLK